MGVTLLLHTWPVRPHTASLHPDVNPGSTPSTGLVRVRVRVRVKVRVRVRVTHLAGRAAHRELTPGCEAGVHTQHRVGSG
eukprot:8327125-Pyramimonas_sp.AAC.1